MEKETLNYAKITQEFAQQYDNGGKITLADLADTLKVSRYEMLLLAASKHVQRLRYGYHTYVGPKVAAEIIADVQVWRDHHDDQHGKTGE